MEEKIAIQLNGVTKKYEIHHDKPFLWEKLFRKRTESFQALKNINLTINKGERVGIMGPNGSGKTLLLKIIVGITKQTTGTIKIRGRVVSLIDLQAGFHPNLTGVQNIFLNATILGLSKKQIIKLLPRIIDFADIGKFIDAPLFTYSAGMALRLGFSIAIHSDPDILVLDEGLNVGDMDFHKKSQIKLQELFTKGKTILVVSHWLDYIERNCDRVLLMNKGHIEKDVKVSKLKFYKRKKLSL